MAIARTGTSRGTAAAGTTASVTRPTGAATGDLLLLAIAAQTATAFTAPAGWTQLVNVQDGAAARRFAVFWKIDDGSAGPFSFTYGGANVFRWWRCVSYSGFDATDPIADFASQINASSVNVVAPTVTVERDGSALVDFSNVDGATASWTPPSGMTAIDDVANAVWTAEQFSLVSGPTGSKIGVVNTAVPNQGSLIVIQPPPALADYVKTVWADGTDATPTRLNKIEQGIYDVTERAQALPSPELVDAIQNALDAAKTAMLARPIPVDTGSAFQVNLTSAAGSFYLSRADGAQPILAAADTQLEPWGYYFDVTEWDVIPGYKPQFRLRGSFHTQTTDPGTQTFTCALTSLVQTTGAAANNTRWTVSGTISSITVTNMAANASSIGVGAWADMTTGLFGVYHTGSVAIAANAVLSTLWQVEVRWVPE